MASTQTILIAEPEAKSALDVLRNSAAKRRYGKARHGGAGWPEEERTSPAGNCVAKRLSPGASTKGDAPSREVATEYCPRRKPWVASARRTSPEGAKERDYTHTAGKALLNIVRPSIILSLLLILPLVGNAAAATKVHVITFGKWTSAQWQPGTGGDNDKPTPIKVRGLIVDGRIKEYTLGTPHEVTDRLFTVRRAFRVNDSLPGDATPSWQWQRGGWLLVDRVTGKISPITLPDFDPFYSAATWYRDYAAYCGIADDGKKTYAVVAQIGRRKPVFKKLLSDKGIPDNSVPDSACPAPLWQRSPTRVSFEPASGTKQTYAIRGHIVDVVNDEDEEDSEGTK